MLAEGQKRTFPQPMRFILKCAKNRQNPTFAPLASSQQPKIKRWLGNGDGDLRFCADDLWSKRGLG
jgi:hypothetical protein